MPDRIANGSDIAAAAVPPPPPVAWYVQVRGEEIGPLGIEQLIPMVIEGRVTGNTLAWKKGMREWEAVSRLPELSLLLKLPKPPSAATGPGPRQKTSTGMSEGYASSFRAGMGRAAHHAKLAASYAAQTIAAVAADPLNGVGEAYERLGKGSAVSAGFFFAGVYELASVLMLRGLIISVSAFFKVLVAAAIPFAAIVLLLSLVRKISISEEGYEADVYVGGIAVLPLGLLWFVAWMMGLGNFEMTTAVNVLAICCAIYFLLFSLIRIYALPPRIAALAVPVIIILCLWIGKVTLFLLLPHGTSASGGAWFLAPGGR